MLKSSAYYYKQNILIISLKMSVENVSILKQKQNKIIHWTVVKDLNFLNRFYLFSLNLVKCEDKLTEKSGQNCKYTKIMVEK